MILVIHGYTMNILSILPSTNVGIVALMEEVSSTRGMGRMGRMGHMGCVTQVVGQLAIHLIWLFSEHP